MNARSCCDELAALVAALDVLPVLLVAAVAELLAVALVAAEVVVAVFAAVVVLVEAGLDAEAISDNTCNNCERLFELPSDDARW